MTPTRLEPAALRSRVKHSTTEPLRSLVLILMLVVVLVLMLVVVLVLMPVTLVMVFELVMWWCWWCDDSSICVLVVLVV